MGNLFFLMPTFKMFGLILLKTHHLHFQFKVNNLQKNGVTLELGLCTHTPRCINTDIGKKV